MFTIGGGTVLDPAAARHRRRRLEEGLNRLEALHSGDPKQILIASMTRDGLPWQIAEMASCLQISKPEAGVLANDLCESDQLLALADGYYFPTIVADRLAEKLEEWLKDYFIKWNMRFSAPKKEVAQVHFPRMDQKMQRAIFQYMEGTGAFEHDEKSIWPVGWKPVIGGKQADVVDAVRKIFEEAPQFAPPTWNSVVTELKIPAKEQGEYLQWFLRSGELIRVADDGLYTRHAVAEAERILREDSPDGGYTVAHARDILGTNRDYACQIVDYFDLTKITYWDGEKHFWRS